VRIDFLLYPAHTLPTGAAPVAGWSAIGSHLGISWCRWHLGGVAGAGYSMLPAIGVAVP